jgi:hypothetical protein
MEITCQDLIHPANNVFNMQCERGALAVVPKPFPGRFLPALRGSSIIPQKLPMRSLILRNGRLRSGAASGRRSMAFNTKRGDCPVRPETNTLAFQAQRIVFCFLAYPAL